MLIAEYSNYINHFPSCYSVTGICFSDRQEPGALHVSVARYRQRETGVTAAGGKGLGEGAPTHGLAQRAGRPGGGGAAGGLWGCGERPPVRGCPAKASECAGNTRRTLPNARKEPEIAHPLPLAALGSRIDASWPQDRALGAFRCDFVAHPGPFAGEPPGTRALDGLLRRGHTPDALLRATPRAPRAFSAGSPKTPQRPLPIGCHRPSNPNNTQ